MPFALKKILNKRFQDLPIEDILQLPISALKGVAASDEALLEQAFNIKTIEDMGSNVFFQRAFNLLRAGANSEFDLGPFPEWNNFFQGAPIDYYLEHASERFRIEFGPVFHRGRLDGTAKVLVIGQDPSTDEIIAQRAFVGASGQRLQRYLNKIGITRSYIIINTFIFSIYGQFDDEMRGISLEPTIKNYRERMINYILEKNEIEAILTFGNGPRHAVENWTNSTGLPIFNLVHPAAPETTAFPSWNTQLPDIIDMVTPDDATLVDASIYEGSWRRGTNRADIPRYDLPFGIPDWHGTRGTRSQRGPSDRKKNITWTSI
ncbi:MAG: uracil-DNA glycosylase [Cyanothece sp. SIO1E1]|nr:uracil-DNA glycosylase [Cyanothece sp. SIO1E1]